MNDHECEIITKRDRDRQWETTEINISNFKFTSYYRAFLEAHQPAVACPTYTNWNPGEGRQEHGEFKTIRAWDACFMTFHRFLPSALFFAKKNTLIKEFL